MARPGTRTLEAVIPVVTAAQMAAADAATLSDRQTGHQTDSDVLVRRAGAAVAASAIRMLGGAYGRRVTVVAGKGNNGADGRVAAERLRDRGAAVTVLEARDCADVLIDAAGCDLLIDAAYGTGFRGTWEPPGVWDVPVLAVDLPSGLIADTGDAEGNVLAATRTVTFAALKPGHLLGDGPSVCGEIELADIGVDVLAHVDDIDTFLVEPADVAAWIPPRPRTSHKWVDAVRVVAGSGGMTGACALACAAAMRAGAGIVHASVRGDAPAEGLPTEVVRRPLPPESWSTSVLDDLGRFGALVIGPGLGRGDDIASEVRAVVRSAAVPVIVDGDGLTAVVDTHGGIESLTGRDAPTVLTPHDGEFAALGGDTVADRVESTRDLARRLSAVVLRKGPTTIVTDGHGPTFLVATGDERLATAGSGDVLSGIIGAFLARDMSPVTAAVAGATVHGLAASLGEPAGMIARDVVAGIGEALARLRDSVDATPVRSVRGGRP